MVASHQLVAERIQGTDPYKRERDSLTIFTHAALYGKQNVGGPSR